MFLAGMVLAMSSIQQYYGSSLSVNSWAEVAASYSCHQDKLS
jgi:hypothetical protein